jgi:glycerol-3-phosphate cytidylyltransferase
MNMIENRVGFTCGAFDVLHAGHFLMLEEAKKQCEYLIVGLQSDPTIDRPEKNKPVQTVEERKIQLEACKFIDEVVVYNTEMELVKLLNQIKPDIRIIGEDWKNKNFTGIEIGIPIHYNERKHDYSSSNLRKRIYEAEKGKYIGAVFG